MKAIVQDTYGSADTLELREIDTPEIGDDDVLVRVRAAGVEPGVWHLMTGQPYLVRVLGYGLRKPKVRVRGRDAAGQRLRPVVSKERSQDLLALKELIEAGKVAPVVDRTYPLSDAPEAIRYLAAEHARGKIVIAV